MKYPTKEQLEEIRARWFKEHVATLTQHAPHIAELVWKKPQSSTYAVFYVLYGGALMVHGDIGEAVYRWGGTSERLSFEWIAKCDLSYFHGKLCASERGRDYFRFDYRQFTANLKREVGEGNVRASGTAWSHAVDDISDEHEAREFLQRYFERNESETLGSLLRGGHVLDTRCAGHLVGIQMAIAQLAAAAQPQPEPAAP